MVIHLEARYRLASRPLVKGNEDPGYQSASRRERGFGGFWEILLFILGSLDIICGEI